MTKVQLTDYLPHKGVIFSPFPEEPPEGWPYEYVARVDFDALAARLAEAERLLRTAIDEFGLGMALGGEIDEFLATD